MKITKSDNFMGCSYSIQLDNDDDLDASEIAECFKLQFPKEVCVISFSRIVKMQVGLLFVGLKLPKVGGKGE